MIVPTRNITYTSGAALTSGLVTCLHFNMSAIDISPLLTLIEGSQGPMFRPSLRCSTQYCKAEGKENHASQSADVESMLLTRPHVGSVQADELNNS